MAQHYYGGLLRLVLRGIKSHVVVAIVLLVSSRDAGPSYAKRYKHC